jgi:hypothetical protein
MACEHSTPEALVKVPQFDIFSGKFGKGAIWLEAVAELRSAETKNETLCGREHRELLCLLSPHVPRRGVDRYCRSAMAPAEHLLQFTIQAPISVRSFVKRSPFFQWSS